MNTQRSIAGESNARTFDNKFSIKMEKNSKKQRIRNGIVTMRCTKAAETGRERFWAILMSRRRLAVNVVPFRSLSSAVASLFISLQSSPSCHQLFPFARMYTTTTVFSSIVAVLSSLCLFSAILVTEYFLRGSCRVLWLLVHPLDPSCYLKAHATRPAVSLPRDYQRRKKGFLACKQPLVADAQNLVAIIIERIEKKFQRKREEKDRMYKT